MSDMDFYSPPHKWGGVGGGADDADLSTNPSPLAETGTKPDQLN